MATGRRSCLSQPQMKGRVVSGFPRVLSLCLEAAVIKRKVLGSHKRLPGTCQIPRVHQMPGVIRHWGHQSLGPVLCSLSPSCVTVAESPNTATKTEPMRPVQPALLTRFEYRGYLVGTLAPCAGPAEWLWGCCLVGSQRLRDSWSISASKIEFPEG